MEQKFQDVFDFCPICGSKSKEIERAPFVCASCEFHFFFPPTIAVGAIITDEKGQVLFIKRAKDPGKGMLGLPGGFVDAGETGEQAVIREIREEVGLDTTEVKFLTTFPNTYSYQGIVTDVLDLFYVCEIESFEKMKIQESEVDSYRFAFPDETIYQQMAFKSNKKAVRFFSAM